MLNPLLVNLEECLALHLRELLESGREPGKPLGKKEARREEGASLVERDEELTRVLDRLILYLRIVHSVDYYGAQNYEEEDLQPRRLGMLTMRGEPSRRGSAKALQAYIRRFESGLAGLVPNEKRLASEHVELLGKREPETECDRFIDANVIIVGDGMSRCTICHKRFTTHEYAAMHMRERHKDKLEEVKWVVVTFNNYLADPSRPSDADFSASAPPPSNDDEDDHPDKDAGTNEVKKPKPLQKPAFIQAIEALDAQENADDDD